MERRWGRAGIRCDKRRKQVRERFEAGEKSLNAILVYCGSGLCRGGGLEHFEIRHGVLRISNYDVRSEPRRGGASLQVIIRHACKFH
jgi:hypothetical protein